MLKASIYIIICVCVRSCAQSLSCVQLFTILWTVACQAPPSMRFSRQEYWNGLPCPPPGDLPDTGIEPVSSVSLLRKWKDKTLIIGLKAMKDVGVRKNWLLLWK